MRPRRRRTRARLARVAVAAILLAGCGSEEPPGEEPATIADASTSSAPAPSTAPDRISESTVEDLWPQGPPTPPEAMQHDNEDGAFAFVEFYIELTTYSYNHLDTTDLARYADADCVGCQATIESVSELQEGGYTVSGGRTSVGDILRTEYYPLDDFYVVEINHTFGEVEMFDRDGTSVRTEPEATGGGSYAVRFNGPYDWTMISMGLTEGGSE